MLRVKLFGIAQAEYCDRRFEGFPEKQSYLLLCYLLLNRSTIHHREHLATEFWGNYPTYTAKKYFRNALWQLRRMLSSMGVPVDRYLQVHEESVSFSTDSPYWLDIEIFETTSKRYAHISPQQLDVNQATELRSAADLYVGDLLEGIYGDWCLYNRERLRLVYLSLLSQLLDHVAFNRDYEQGLEYGERILKQDNTREDIHRQMMWMYWQTGNHYSALNQYKLCCQILREELDIPPMEATRQLYDQMLHHQVGFSDLEYPFRAHSPVLGAVDPGIKSLAKHAMGKMQNLEKMLLATTSELQQLKNILKVIYSGNNDQESNI